MSSVDNRDAEKEDISSARVRTLVDAWQARDPDAIPRGKLSIDASTINDAALADDTDSSPPVQPSPPRDATEPHGKHSSEGSAPPTIIAKDERRPGFMRQTAVLTVRAHKNVYRNVPQLIGFLFQGSLLGVVIGLTYYQLPEVRYKPLINSRL